MVKHLFALLLFLSGILSLSAQTSDTRQRIYNPSFKTLQVEVEGRRMMPPVISLNGDDRILISFDELADERRYMRYELIHCDASWRPEGLVDSEFLDGFNQGEVDDYDYSRATTVHYVNYRIAIPNAQMRPLISGNYLVRVYPEDDPESTLLTARFSISEDSMAITGDVSSRTDIDTNDSHQQLSVTVDAGETPIDDIYSDLRLIIEQNGRSDNSIEITRPLRAVGKKAIFEHLRPMIFNAGNEYRRMETVSVNYPGMHVESIDRIEPFYHFTLATDAPRKDEMYLYDQTQHGRFTIREYDSDRSDTEADYALVDIALEMDELHGFDVYLDGDFTQRSFDDSSKMLYNRATGRYEKRLLLKQGAYNYQYLAVADGQHIGLTSAIEGDKYPTVNEYTVRVYYRPRGSRYDRLAGVKVFYSNQ